VSASRPKLLHSLLDSGCSVLVARKHQSTFLLSFSELVTRYGDPTGWYCGILGSEQCVPPADVFGGHHPADSVVYVTDRSDAVFEIVIVLLKKCGMRSGRREKREQEYVSRLCRDPVRSAPAVIVGRVDSCLVPVNELWRGRAADGTCTVTQPSQC
jgi:hypothetical protein